MLSFQRSVSCFLVLSVSFASVGCGGGDGLQLVPATGVVTFEGKPIEKINVMFEPVSQEGLIAEGTSDADGKFELKTRMPGDGAMPGEYKVSFKYISDVIPDMPGFEGGVKPEPSPIPEKYADANESGFTATVDADASQNEFKFDLKK